MKRLIPLFLSGILLFPLSSFAGETILNLPGVGKVISNPVRRTLTFISDGTPMEFSVCWNSLHWNASRGLYVGGMKCVQGEVGGWAKPEFKKKKKTIKEPHYRTFIVTIGRYKKIASAICRENDGQIGCVKF